MAKQIPISQKSRSQSKMKDTLFSLLPKQTQDITPGNVLFNTEHLAPNPTSHLFPCVEPLLLSCKVLTLQSERSGNWVFSCEAPSKNRDLCDLSTFITNLQGTNNQFFAPPVAWLQLGTFGPCQRRGIDIRCHAHLDVGLGLKNSCGRRWVQNGMWEHLMIDM